MKELTLAGEYLYCTVTLLGRSHLKSSVTYSIMYSNVIVFATLF